VPTVLGVNRVSAIARRTLTQPGRLIAAAIYLGLLLLVGRILTGRLPTPDAIGLWFYVGAANLVVSRLIVEPFFTRPADAITAAVALAMAVVAIDYPAGAAVSKDVFNAGRTIFLIYAVVVVLIAGVAVLLKDTPSTQPIARAATAIVGTVFRSTYTYSALFLASVYLSFGRSAADIAILYLTWFVVAPHPIEGLARLAARLTASQPDEYGRIVAVLEPQTIDVEMSRSAVAKTGERIWFPELKTWATVVDVSGMRSRQRCRLVLDEVRPIAAGDELFRVNQSAVEIVGRVAPGSQVSELMVEIAQDQFSALAIGRLVAVEVGENDVLYQVSGAEVRKDTGEESKEYVRADAWQLGTWDAAVGTFRQLPWLPIPGSRVRTVASTAAPLDMASFGHVPQTQFGVRMDMGSAVPANTVIIGVIGSGKTHAAWELIRRALAVGTKIVVLDITGRYSREFRDILDSGTESGIATVINAQIRGKLASRSIENNEAGNVIEFRRWLRDFIEDFVTSRYLLVVLNPAELKVTRLEGYQRDGQAQGLSELTPAEITRHIAEMSLQVVQKADRTGQSIPPLWIVLEEAHSLVPEMNSTAVAAEQRAATATARAILQGRKYGLGCLVVTQRTANVSKTLLTQCNTLVALRTMDATGVEFVGTMLGVEAARLLPSLPERQGLVFGLGSSCPNPVIVELNDYRQFRHRWIQASPAVQRTIWDK
jgi:uncharacterized protein